LPEISYSNPAQEGGASVAQVGELALGVGALVKGGVKFIGRYADKLDDVANGVLRTADEVNADFPSGYSAPYTPGTDVVEFTADGTDSYVRIVTGSRPQGQWVMREEDIAGLSPEQIADKFALPDVPTGVTKITPPNGTQMRTGEVNANFGRTGGATQFQLLDRVTKGWEDVRPIK